MGFIRFKFINNMVVAFLLFFIFSINAQNYQPTPNDTLQSITIMQDAKVSFRIYAPNANEVKLGGSDFPNTFANSLMTKKENGVWEVVIGPLKPGSYRYNFVVDKVVVIDPKNPRTSESNMNTWSLFHIEGAGFMDIMDVPHGAVSTVIYYSKSLNKFRRMHIYTPPGYETNNEKYPVFYLLHGAFDSDDSWSSVGRAGFIFDNLIAQKKAVPIVVVMPAGHTGSFNFGMRRDSNKPFVDEFIEDFNQDIKSLVEKNYRVYIDRKHRAIAGLSMGGAHTLNIAIPHLEDYSYFGVFSSGEFSLNRNMNMGQNNGTSWEEKNLKTLSDENLKNDLKLVWFATGKEDFLLETTKATVELLRKHKFDVIFKETNGGHTWENWREYLNEFAQLLFK